MRDLFPFYKAHLDELRAKSSEYKTSLNDNDYRLENIANNPFGTSFDNDLVCKTNALNVVSKHGNLNPELYAFAYKMFEEYVAQNYANKNIENSSSDIQVFQEDVYGSSIMQMIKVGAFKAGRDLDAFMNFCNDARYLINQKKVA